LPVDIKRFDVNADCIFDLLDAVYLFMYIYADGEPPRYGCAEN
jgi:hypothetical protein